MVGVNEIYGTVGVFREELTAQISVVCARSLPVGVEFTGNSPREIMHGIDGEAGYLPFYPLTKSIIDIAGGCCGTISKSTVDLNEAIFRVIEICVGSVLGHVTGDIVLVSV